MNILVGIILIVAGCFKTLALYSDPVELQQPDWIRAILPIEIVTEIGMALLALVGVYWQQVRRIAINLFAGFSAYSLYLALQGAESCGCFGPVKVNPWWTFGLDVVVVAGLVVEWWWERRFSPSPNLSPEYRGEGLLENPSPNLSHEYAGERQNRGEGFWKLVGIGGVSVALFVVLLWQTRPVVHADGVLQTVSGLTILEPTEWTGQRFPLTDSIDVDLSRGEWLVVLHRHDCHDCQEAVPLYEELAASDAGKRVELIEVPPFGEEDPSPSLSPEYRGEGQKCVHGRLATDHEWFVQTPVEIRIRDGVVVAASTELPALSVARHSVSCVGN